MIVGFFLCAFTLLTNKLEWTHNQFFAQLLVLFMARNDVGPVDILVDFEREAINSLSNLQPQL